MGGGIGGMGGGLPSMDGLDGMGGMDGSQGSTQGRVCMLYDAVYKNRHMHMCFPSSPHMSNHSPLFMLSPDFVTYTYLCTSPFFSFSSSTAGADGGAGRDAGRPISDRAQPLSLAG